MRKRLWFLALSLLLLALFATACGMEEDAEKMPEEPETNEGTSGGIAAGEPEPAIKQLDDKTYLYTVKNQTEKPLTFDFTSSQRYDFALLDESGEQVFLQSSVSMYAQALGEETVKQAEELEYEIEVPPLELEPGTYTLEAWLTPEQGPAFRTETEYVVE
ncbi:intracellular proteinase inhibitor (BsuPI) [Planomicrobium chinense]|uniref:Intracellular proteinase inhibitor (BsuPI) n=1 Tax=Planococcus glaciei TaxID=459472 RepID=A0A7H8QAX9_9BACL|nr:MULTISPECIES: BsuPI-related putative proteinase inhibitor [Planococcus]ETP69791.1 hypothetical protein G159_05335 [Planococcus glaciei CHR43]KOF10525.1 hypothetical protein AC739_09240 [Planococcus glaciei]MBX0316441.1 intracellular proteinase inhibitor (BsuPI) [Planococcus glaciei]MBZ5202630.1 intracellular proteinase inhibitor (BsuPI) [Planococcus chinensis]QDY45915.1 intracellular proteinase inhibitor (BsuPI) [Planococcus glaciei]